VLKDGKGTIDMRARIQAQTIASGDTLQTWLIRAMLVLIFLMAGVIGVGIVNEPAKIEGVVIYNLQPRGHDNSFAFPVGNLPPVGGVHHSLIQNCGIYLALIEPEKAVHSMEHGAVWITYQPGLAEADIAFLQETVRGQEYLLLSPFPEQRSPVVLTTWGVQLEISSVHDGRLEEFIARYRLGPTTPERGASCAGGSGDPLP
jgi:hypothetical protein